MTYHSKALKQKEVTMEFPRKAQEKARAAQAEIARMVAARKKITIQDYDKKVMELHQKWLAAVANHLNQLHLYLTTKQ